MWKFRTDCPTDRLNRPTASRPQDPTNRTNQETRPTDPSKLPQPVHRTSTTVITQHSVIIVVIVVVVIIVVVIIITMHHAQQIAGRLEDWDEIWQASSSSSSSCIRYATS